MRTWRFIFYVKCNLYKIFKKNLKFNISLNFIWREIKVYSQAVLY